MSRRFGIGLLIACVTAVVVPVLLVLGITGYFHRDMIDSIYKNVEDIADATEMPPTVTSFQSSPEVVSTIGGSGEGLNCSLPGLANMFFDDIKNQGGHHGLVLQRFRQACVFHDLCYRHGLATYGYNQNDCDRILQNAALRLCNVWNPIDRKRCQTESKMVLAGVSLGGSDAYRAWDRSTYFEFEPDPSRSSRFLVSRVVDHPFKSVDRDKYKDDPDQVILTFDNVRSNLTVTCLNCKDAPVLKPTNDRYDLSAELRSVGIKRIPNDLLKRGSSNLSDTNAVWLPPRRRHAAPHLLVDGAGKNRLIWITRNNSGDTMTCMVMGDAAKLLTHTLPERDLCSEEADSQLSMVEADMFSTSPLPMEIPARNPKDNIFATAITVKSFKRDLGFCSRSASRTIDQKAGEDDKAKCIRLDDVKIFEGAGLGAFQNFAIVRPGQLVLFARDVALATATTSAWTRFSQNIWGVKHSPNGVMLVIDVAAPSSEKGPLAPKIRKMVKFNIEDRFDPMMPITRRRDDLRFLSLETTDKEVGVRMIDFAKEDPAVGDVRLEMNGSKVNLHRSWASRPALVLETREPNPKTKLVFSRGAIAADPHESFDDEPDIAEPSNRPFNATKPQTESLALETLIFERDAASSADKPFVKTNAATCMVKYTFRRHEEFLCYRKFDPQRPMRASPAARMQASQLLVGRFAGRDGYGIAFPEFCASGPPIILRQNGDGTFVPEEGSTGGAGTFTRQVTCKPLDSNAYVGGPIKATPDMTISAADWPYQR